MDTTLIQQVRAVRYAKGILLNMVEMQPMKIEMQIDAATHIVALADVERILTKIDAATYDMLMNKPLKKPHVPHGKRTRKAPRKGGDIEDR